MKIVSDQFWQAKIWGLLHDPALKALQDNSGRGSNGFWRELKVMRDWTENQWDPEKKDYTVNGEKVKGKAGTALEWIHNADYIASASDRAAIGSLTHSIDYDRNGLTVTHLLSGAEQDWKLKDEEHHKLITPPDRKKRVTYLCDREKSLLPDSIRNSDDPRLVFWWLWRCLPQAVCTSFNDDSLGCISVLQ